MRLSGVSSFLSIIVIAAASMLLFTACGSGGGGSSDVVENNDEGETIMPEEPAAQATPNYVFVTSVQGNGNLGTWDDAHGETGLAAGDEICQTRAEAAGMAGTFIAWLSDDNDDAYCRINGLTGKKADNCGQDTLPADAGPWLRTDGFPFGEAIDELMSGAVYAPVRYDEFGSKLPDYSNYYTATSTNGSLHQNSHTKCDNWTNSDPVDSEDANAHWVWGSNINMTSNTWTLFNNLRCADNSIRLFCMQTGEGSALPELQFEGKKVFVTSARGTAKLETWPEANGKKGLEAGDEICRTSAEAAGLSGTFVAWLSDSSNSAIDRLTGNGPWVRLDGVKVADDKDDLTDGELFSSIALTEKGEYRAISSIWTGTNNDGTSVDDTNRTCSDWTYETQSDTIKGAHGMATESKYSWSNYYDMNCSYTNAYLYCFETDN